MWAPFIENTACASQPTLAELEKEAEQAEIWRENECFREWKAVAERYKAMFKRALSSGGDHTGTCPLEQHGFDRDCENKCDPDIDFTECWTLYYDQKVRNENI